VSLRSLPGPPYGRRRWSSSAPRDSSRCGCGSSAEVRRAYSSSHQVASILAKSCCPRRRHYHFAPIRSWWRPCWGGRGWLPWLLIACAKPLTSSVPPKVAELEGQEVVAARRYSGCWAVHNAGPDSADGMAELVILERDTVALIESGAGPLLLRAVGRSGVRRPAPGRAPKYGWSLLGEALDTIDAGWAELCWVAAAAGG